MRIQSGCKARIINSRVGNNGRIVTVIRKIGHVAGFTKRHGGRWEVDIELKVSDGYCCNHVGELQLERIDNYDGNKVVSWESLQDIWVPEAECVERDVRCRWKMPLNTLIHYNTKKLKMVCASVLLL